ncbi:MAG: DegQ family serine endoprotease [Planctomycetaceae bacterium]|nr:DegQ family serine endoprotease [Planctomycetales bacterium]MCB9924440.1 DegQ family serine endoprotease [Planctomycetaceae bacterium]
MTQHHPRKSTYVIVPLFIFMIATASWTWPYVVAQATYAIERGQAEASQQQLAVATDLSQAFQHVARSMRPAVVSVSSIKRIRLNQPQARRYDSQMPEELRRFFGGDDFFGRFPFEIPNNPQGYEQRGLGTGVIVTSDGYILTNNHVVDDADEVSVTLTDKRQFTAAVIGTDKATDVAVLKIDASNLHAAKLGDSNDLQVGEWALAVGSPFGLDQTVTAGIISAIGRANVGITDYEDFIQTDAAINPGNSGGPLVNLRGEVIGINTAIASRNGGYQGIGFAIPSNMARHVLDSIIKDGQVTRGYLGALIQDLSTDLAKSFGYNSTEGVLIGDVVDDGPAAKAGMKPGDIVLKFNGAIADNANQFRNAIAATAPKTEMELLVFRDGKREKIAVVIGQLDAEQLAVTHPGEASTDDLGMSVQNFTPELARQFGYGRDERGVMVTNVDPSGLAARAGIRAGDLIVTIGGQTVESVSDFRESLRSQESQAGIRMQILRDGVRRFVFMREGR